MMMQHGPGEGGNDLFQSLYKRYAPRVRRYLRRTFHLSEAEAEDLTQDTFVRLWKALPSYRGEAEWGFIETIARNVGYNHVRTWTTMKRGVKTESLEDVELGRHEPETQEPSALDQLIDDERRTRMREAISVLPKGQKQCLQLSLEDVSNEEISGSLRISLDAVKSRIRDARRRLRERLGDEGVLPEV